jgi:hypothetical protein
MKVEGVTASRQRQYPLRFVVVVVVVKVAKRMTMMMRFVRRNLLSFVGEIEPQSNSPESHFCEISGDVP